MSEYNHITVKPENIKRLVNKTLTTDLKKLVRELFGYAPGKVSQCSIIFNNSYLIVSGDDGGLSEKNIQNLTEYFGIEGSGHCEWGLGSRCAVMSLLIQSGENTAYITDGVKAVEYKLEDNELYWKLIDDIRTISYDIDMFSEHTYLAKKSSKRRVTSWIVPCKYNDENTDQVKKMFTTAWSNEIAAGTVVCHFNKERVEVKNGLFFWKHNGKFMENKSNVEIYFGKKLRKNEKTGVVEPRDQNRYIYRYKDAFFESKKNGTIVKITEQEIGDASHLKLKYVYNDVYVRPTYIKAEGFDQRGELCQEYGIDKITKLHGIYFHDKNVVLHNDIIPAPGHRRVGNNSDMQFLIGMSRYATFINSETNVSEPISIINTKIQKADDPTIDKVHEPHLKTLMNILIYEQNEKNIYQDDEDCAEEEIENDGEEFTKEEPENEMIYPTISEEVKTEINSIKQKFTQKNPEKKQVTRHSKPCNKGFIYVYTVPYWINDDGERVYKVGKTTDYERRMSEAQMPHPTVKIKREIRLEVPDADNMERIILERIQSEGIQHKTHSQTSEYFINFPKFKEILNTIIHEHTIVVHDMNYEDPRHIG